MEAVSLFLAQTNVGQSMLPVNRCECIFLLSIISIDTVYFPIFSNI